MTETEILNKDLVLRFKKEFIEKGRIEVYHDLVAPDFINHTAPPGTDAGPESAKNFILNVLRPAFPDLKVEIQDMIAEKNKVVTRKSFTGTHAAPFMGYPPDGRLITLKIIDIIVLEAGKYKEHWSIRDFQELFTGG